MTARPNQRPMLIWLFLFWSVPLSVQIAQPLSQGVSKPPAASSSSASSAGNPFTSYSTKSGGGSYAGNQQARRPIIHHGPAQFTGLQQNHFGQSKQPFFIAVKTSVEKPNFIKAVKHIKTLMLSVSKLPVQVVHSWHGLCSASMLLTNQNSK